MVKKWKCVICYFVYIKTNDVYKDIAEVVETRFDTSIFKLNIALPKGKKKKVIDVMKNEYMEKQWKDLLE